MTTKQQLYYCNLILSHVKKLSPDFRQWLLRRLAEVECNPCAPTEAPQ